MIQSVGVDLQPGHQVWVGASFRFAAAAAVDGLLRLPLGRNCFEGRVPSAAVPVRTTKLSQDVGHRFFGFVALLCSRMILAQV